MKKKNFFVSAIVPAAGSGARMGLKQKKQFVEVCGKPVIAHTLQSLSVCPQISEIIIATAGEDIVYCADIVREFDIGKPVKIICGGLTRQETVAKCVSEACEDYVLIHDAARPLVTTDEIAETIEDAIKFRAAAAGIPLSDTIKLADENDFVLKTLPRENLVRILTPQVIEKELYIQAFNAAKKSGVTTSDDISLVELLGIKPKISKGNPVNIKITYPEDIEFAEKVLENI